MQETERQQKRERDKETENEETRKKRKAKNEIVFGEYQRKQEIISPSSRSLERTQIHLFALCTFFTALGPAPLSAIGPE